jgi:uncharacterized protein YciI
MQFFFYCRDKAGTGELRLKLLKDHWAFMHRYTDAMIARGPTMSADGKTVTGSMHIVDLPDEEAAKVFANDDPLAKGGVFEDIMVRRFYNILERTMWQFESNPKNKRFLFIGEARPGASALGRELLGSLRDCLARENCASHVIVFGPLLGADGETWEGTTMLLETPDATAAEALVKGVPAAAANLYGKTQLLPWRFGGEENLRDLLKT